MEKEHLVRILLPVFITTFFLMLSLFVIQIYHKT